MLVVNASFSSLRRGQTANCQAAGINPASDHDIDRWVSLRQGHCGPRTGSWRPTLCENYWFPLYAFVRRAGHTADDAQDLTQEFFVCLLAQRFFAKADRQKGKSARSFWRQWSISWPNAKSPTRSTIHPQILINIS